MAQLANVPEELRTGKRFVCWREEIRDGNRTKVPVNPHTGGNAMPNNPATWVTLAEAVARYQKYPNKLAGVGRMFDDADDYVGIDFDDCLDEHGGVRPDHPTAKWIRRFNSYSEVSPSGSGLKVFVRSKHKLNCISGTRNALLQTEMYRSKRFFTLTGERRTEYSAQVEAREEEVAELWSEITPRNKPANPRPMDPTVITQADADIISRASKAKNGDKFKALWYGDFGSYGSPSEADAAMCSLLWFWSGDREQVRRLFGQSALGQHEKWQRRDYQDATLDLACSGEVHSSSRPGSDGPSIPDPTDQMQVAIHDSRPKVRLHGDNWLLSETAAELGRHLADKSLFVRHGELVALAGTELRTVTPQGFRTLAERYVIGYRKRKPDNNAFDVNITMTNDEATGILASPQFLEQIRQVIRLNLCRQPIHRADGVIELLPEGYDSQSKTLTVSTVSYQEDIPLATARETIDELFGEFSFPDGERSKAVAISALVSLYAPQLLPSGSLRPVFIVTKNAEGAGASTIVACAVVPVIGELPTGVKANDEDETRKSLTAAVREGRSVILFDNQKSRLSSASLEAFVTAPTWRDRLLGVNQTITAPNLATVFVTANGCTVDPDMRRRSLFIELHLEAERAEDRQFKRPLNLPTLLRLRPKILAACWSLVRHWQAQERAVAEPVALGIS